MKRVLVIGLILLGVATMGVSALRRDTLNKLASGILVPNVAVTGALEVDGTSTLTGTATFAGNTIGNGSTAEVHFCGQLIDGTTPASTYLGPDVAAFRVGGSNAAGGTTCDGLDSTTEATADNPLLLSTAFSYKVLAMRCHTSSDPSANVVFTARTAEGDLSSTLTCTVAGTGTSQDCFVRATTPVTLAGSAVVDVAALVSENLSAQDASCWWIIAPTT